MAIFFVVVVGLEIKRELVTGELRQPRRAALPAIAAIGGMAVPALLFAVFNAGGDGSKGWGIAMATDIAFDDAALLDDAKLGVLAASVIAAAIGATVLARQRVSDPVAAPPADPT